MNEWVILRKDVRVANGNSCLTSVVLWACFTRTFSTTKNFLLGNLLLPNAPAFFFAQLPLRKKLPISADSSEENDVTSGEMRLPVGQNGPHVVSQRRLLTKNHNIIQRLITFKPNMR